MNIQNDIDSKKQQVGLSKSELPTPALVLDLDVFESNIKKMADHASVTGKSLRPHAKSHKCVAIAKRQLAAGAIGICVATVPEAELMVGNEVRGVLLTSPIADPRKMARMIALSQIDGQLMVAVDHDRQVNLYQQAAAAADVELKVLVDLNVGDGRTGVRPGEAASQLARSVAGQPNLQLNGLQAYSGSSSHVVGFEARRSYSQDVMQTAAETRQLLQDNGLPVEILSGASTGTYNIDSDIAGVTELQVGSYIFMDVDYMRIGGSLNRTYDDFGPSLSVLSSVISANQPERVTVDAGIKSFATDRTFGPRIKDLDGVSFRIGGDEFGYVEFENSSRLLGLGDRIEFIVPHCDPNVNLYDRIYACRGDTVEDVWSVMGRWRAI